MNSIGKEDKVSIVLPLYNAELTIISCVRSVLDQTYQNWELIIINDGSADKSVEVFLDFFSKLNLETKAKIIFLSQQNKGPSFTRNRGIKLATGNFIAFLDSDDLWVKDKLTLQIHYLNKFREVGVVGGGFNKPLNLNGRDYIKISYRRLLFKNYFLTPTVIIRKEFLDEEIDYFNETKKYSEDYDLWLRLIYKRQGLYINQILAKNIIGKANFGESGLSANLDLMQKGEISNYFFQYQQRRISFFTLLIVIGFSYLKYFRRKWIVKKRL